MSIFAKNRIPKGICNELRLALDYNYDLFYSLKFEMGLYNNTEADEYVQFSFCPFCGSKIVSEFVVGQGTVWRYQTDLELLNDVRSKAQELSAKFGLDN